MRLLTSAISACLLVIVIGMSSGAFAIGVSGALAVVVPNEHDIPGPSDYPGPSDDPEPPVIRETPEPSIAPSPSASEEATPSPTPQATSTPRPTSSPSPALTPTATSTPTATPATLTPSPSGAVPPGFGSFEPTVELQPRVDVQTPRFTVELSALIGFPVAEAKVVVDAAGLLAGSRIDIEMRSEPLDLGSVLVGSNGAVGAIASLPRTVPPGVHAIYVRGIADPGGPLPAELERVATISVDGNGIVIGIMQDLREVPTRGSEPQQPSEPIQGRGETTIIKQQGGTLLYVDERISTSAAAAGIRSASAALSSPATFSGGTVSVLIIAMLGVLLELPFNFINERAKRVYGALLERIRRASAGPATPRILGVRIDVILFLAAGQAIAQLNAPLEAIPPLGQIAQAALFGALAIFAISTWYALPHIVIHRRFDRDQGDFRAEWPSLIIAGVALVAAHASGIVPGFIIGLFTIRKFRKALPESLSARGAWIASMSLVVFAMAAWAAMDAVGASIRDATHPLRVVADGVLGVIIVAGSQGALFTLLDPGDDGATALRRGSLVGWLSAITASGGLSFALLATGQIDLALFAPPSTLEEYVALLAFALASLGTIALLHRLLQRTRVARRPKGV